VHHEAPIRSGEIAVVVIGEEATVKRFFPRRDKIVLSRERGLRADRGAPVRSGSQGRGQGGGGFPELG